MKILITGKGTSASWQVRGVQLGQAIDATVQPKAVVFDGVDLVIGIKRVPKETHEALIRRGGPWVWDIVDAWPQPVGNEWSREASIEWLKQEIDRLHPTAMVFPTIRMQEDSGFRGPSLVLPHHAWPRYKLRKITQVVHTVGYEGGAHYLGKWQPLIERECTKYGWYFALNKDLANSDIGIALRDVGGYPAAAWKSNCKLANLQALGLPSLCSPEQGYTEFSSGAERWVSTPQDLREAFTALVSYKARCVASEQMRKACPRLEQVAEAYKSWLLSNF